MNDDSDKYEFTRGSLTQFGLRNASYALTEILDGMDEGLADHPELVNQLVREGVWDQFQDEHRQVKLVPGFLLNIADAMDQEIENCGGREGEVTLKIRTHGKREEKQAPVTKSTMDDLTPEDIGKVISGILQRIQGQK